jgi:glycosyl hydrolase family 115 (putative glucuronidase)
MPRLLVAMAIAGFVLPGPHIAAQRAAGGANASIVVDGTTSILLGADEAPALAAAVDDLASDFEKVLGRKPRIVHRPEDGGASVIVVGQRSAVVAGLRGAVPGDPESFSISVKRTGWKTGPSRVVLLTGADMRGAIYSVYQFSERYLGVDPLYYWTDHTPARKERVEVPAALSETFPAPVFKYRGFFVNDEDLLTGWASGEQHDHTGISLAVWNRIYETTLRLKGNIVAPGTWIFPDEPQITLAGKRGLIVTQHHAIPLGVNVARWPENAPYSYTAHPEILQHAWKNAVAAYAPDQEVLWTVGLRGLSDASYASYDQSVQNDTRAAGRVIGNAMAEQVRIVRAAHPDAAFITNLWQEGAGLVQRGELTIPSDVHAVWADDGYGNLQDGGKVSAGQGAYYHVAMMNGRANQLTEMVPVERIVSELGRYIAAKATHYLLVNTSDIRPVSMTIRAVMDTAWKGLPEKEESTAAGFYRQWSRDQFGTNAADRVAAVYEQYFKAPARVAGAATREFGDQLYHTEARRLILTELLDTPLFSIPSQAPPWMPPRRVANVIPGKGPVSPKEWLRDTIATDIERCRDAEPRWDAVWQSARDAEHLVPPERLPFYRAHVLAMIAINRNSNRMLRQLAQAIQASEAGKVDDARQLLSEALQAIDEIRQAEGAAEYGPWKNWYAGDWLTNVGRTRETIQLYAKHLDDPLSSLPSAMLWDWEAYYHILHYEGDRVVDVK